MAPSPEMKLPLPSSGSMMKICKPIPGMGLNGNAGIGLGIGLGGRALSPEGNSNGVAEGLRRRERKEITG